ncbi:MFS transporter [Mangrovimicrobium sediminis]|uniref:MFS transporter n=1 Tax=Mangrovimicrobium sediminis TaxID=2562682 RepID=A0A4Z0LZL2_9GAMM|nr:MFS transporter [Haliea sp. SAOS-164]
MWLLVQPIRAILTSVALLLLGSGLLNTLLSLTANDLGYSTSVIGLIMSSYFAGFTCGTFVSGRLIKRMGHIRTFAFCAAVCASMALLHMLWVSAPGWMLLRFVYGLSFVTLMTVIESWLNARAAREERGKVFAVYMVVNLGAIAVAQQLLRLDVGQGYVLFAIASILISWALLPITITRKPQPQIPERAKSSLRTLLGFAPVPVAGAALSGLAMGAFWGMVPLYASRQGFDTGAVGLLMSLTIVGGALLQVPIGRYSDTHDRRAVLMAVACAAALLALCMPLAPGHTALMAVFFLWGGMAFSLYPLAVAQLLDQLHPDEVISGTTTMLVLHGAGAAFAPMLAGAAMEVVGLQGLPLYAALVLACLGGFTLYQMRRVSVLPAGEHAHFEPMVATSHEVLGMIEKEDEEKEEEKAEEPAAA